MDTCMIHMDSRDTWWHSCKIFFDFFATGSGWSSIAMLEEA
jgi:hypothetical protein